MRITNFNRATLICLFLCTAMYASTVSAQEATNFTPGWVQRSNEIAYNVLDSSAKFMPEFAGPRICMNGKWLLMSRKSPT
jgi:hypothetical protein